MGMFLNSFLRRADVVKMANLAQLVNVIAPIFTNKEGLFLQPIYFPIAEYGKQRGLQSLDLLVKSPMYTPKGKRPLGYLDVSGTYDPKSRSIFLNVLNRSESQDIAARIDNTGASFASDVAVWEMQHADLKATHTFGDDKRIRPATRTFNASVANQGFTYTFPKRSLTILRLKAQ
jgi:alpha-N-arabinofuranosidase